ncbi:reverse transcriptase domain-containing protein [Tanacetum coccineum]
MTGVPRHIAEHRLNVREGCSPVRQKKRGQAADRNQAIQEEVGKLVEAGIMKEVHYHDWLSNPVMVKKHDDSWRMCSIQRDLTKQAQMKWNARATYQRLVDKAFHKQIGRNLEVYVDDLVIKSRTEDEIVRDIEETFKTLREINMKLNPKKYTFEVEEGIFLGYKVNSKGLKVCPDKVIKYVVLSLPSVLPKCLKDVQKLNGKLASLNRFLAKSAEKSLPFFKTLKKAPKKRTSIGKKTPNVSILADFIVERPEEDSPDTLIEEDDELPEPWILFTDGSSCTDGSRAGLILTNPEGMEFTYALRFRFDATNNEAEYEALIAGLRIAEQMGVKNLQANVDSRLVANQVNETYVAKEADMVRYLEKVKALTGSFKAFTIKQIPRSKNKKSDALSKIASTSFAHLSKQVLVEELKEKSISEVEVLTVVEEEGDTWMTPIYKYLAEETLPADMKKARAIKRKSWRFTIINGILYKKSFFLGIQWPQTNGLVETANRSLGEGIKARLKARIKNWMEELPHVLWAHRTMIKSSNGDTPFSLTYGTEAVIPAEIGMPTTRIMEVDLVQNNEALEINLDLLEERREEAAIREAKSKAKMEKYYNAKVRNTSFKPGDLVYRNNDASRAEDTGKLGPKWEGPYEVTEALGKGAYKLKDRDGKQLPRTWNISNLKKCYVHKM